MQQIPLPLQSVAKGLRNGLQYGSKVRFVHTLVMTLLFKDIKVNQIHSLLKNILSMAFEHGKNLGLFVLSYKGLYKLLDYCFDRRSTNHLIAGAVFGSIIFGKKTGVNHQIVLYLLSRVSIGLATLAYKKVQHSVGKIGLIERGYGYYLLAAVCWGIVMWLFEKDKKVLQPSLKNSMEFLYKESDNVQSLTQLIPFYPKAKTDKKIKKKQLQPTKSLQQQKHQQMRSVSKQSQQKQ